MSEAKRSASLVSGSAKLLGANLLLMLTSYLTLLGIARLTDVERFGRYTVVIAVLLWLERLTAEAFKHPLIRQIASGSWSGTQRVLLRQGVLSAAVAALLLLGAPLIALLLGSPQLTAPLRAAAADVLPFAAYASGVAALTAYDAYGSNALAGCVYGLAKLVLMLAAAWSFGTVESIVLAMAGASLLAAGFVAAAGRRLKLAADLRSRAEAAPQHAPGLAYWCALGVIGGSGILLSGDLWLVQAWSSDGATVGLYGAAHNLTKALYMGGAALMWPMIPAVARRRDLHAAMAGEPQLRILLRLLLCGLAAGFFICLLGGSDLLALLFGEEYFSGGRFLGPLAAAHVCLTLALVSAQLCYHSGSPLIAARVVAGGALVFVVLGCVSADSLGLTAVPWTLLVCSAGMLALLLVSVFCNEGRACPI